MRPSYHDPEQQQDYLSVDGYCQQFREGKITVDVFRAYLIGRVPRRDVESYVNLNWPTTENSHGTILEGRQPR